MQRDRFTSLVWGALALCLGLIQWQAWSRAQAELAVGTADMAWAAARAAGSFLILAALARAAWWTAGGHPVRWRRAGDGRFVRLVALALGGTLVVGMSGAVSALGDADRAAGLGKELDVLHPLAAVVVSFVLLRLASAVRSRRRRPGGPPGGEAAAEAAARWANRLHLLVFAQLALGTFNTVVVGSLWVELAHLLLADLVWIVLVLTCAASLPAE